MQHEVDKCVLTAHAANVRVSDVCGQLGDDTSSYGHEGRLHT